MSSIRHYERAVFKFHMKVGTRLALRVFSPLPAAALAVVFLLGPQFILFLSGILFQAETAWFTVPLVVLPLLLTAAAAARRICLGLGGWIRHLPCREASHRVFAGLAVTVSQIPVLLIIAFALLASASAGDSNQTPRLTGLPILGLGSAAAVLPFRRKWISVPMGTAACLVCLSGSWLGLISAAFFIFMCYLYAGNLKIGRERAVQSRPERRGAAWFFLGLRWRAVRFRFLPLYGIAGIPIAAAFALYKNNQLSPSQSGRVFILGEGIGLVIFCALFAGVLTLRLPPWPWLRTLPQSSSRRIIDDAGVIGMAALPVSIPAAVIGPEVFLPLVLGLFPLAFMTAGAMRLGEDRKLGILGMILIPGCIGALALCILPWLAWIAPVLSWPVYRRALLIERRRKISRWSELHHLSAGDSLSWSRS